MPRDRGLRLMCSGRCRRQPFRARCSGDPHPRRTRPQSRLAGHMARTLIFLSRRPGTMFGTRLGNNTFQINVVHGAAPASTCMATRSKLRSPHLFKQARAVPWASNAPLGRAFSPHAHRIPVLPGPSHPRGPSGLHVARHVHGRTGTGHRQAHRGHDASGRHGASRVGHRDPAEIPTAQRGQRKAEAQRWMSERQKQRQFLREPIRLSAPPSAL